MLWQLHTLVADQMFSVLMTGGTGFVGERLRQAVRETPITLLSRQMITLFANENRRYLDMAEYIEPEKLDGGDILCHLAYSMPVGRNNIIYNRNLLEAVNASPNVKRVILMSSVSVYGRNYSLTIDEESSCYPVGEYPETKLACETVWREELREDCELTVLRPTEVIGVGGKGLLTMVHDALERPLIGAIKRSVLYHRSLHYVAVSNVVAAILFCLQRSQNSLHETFIVSDDTQPENRSYAAMQDLVRKLSGEQPLPGLALPRPLLQLVGRVTRRPLGLDQVFDDSKIQATGFERPVSLGDEVAHLVQRASVE